MVQVRGKGVRLQDTMKIADDSWLGGVLGRPAFRVNLPELDASAPSAIRDHARAHDRPFYFAKVEAERVDKVQLLSQAGFSAVDVNVTFALAAPEAARPRTVDVGGGW